MTAIKLRDIDLDEITLYAGGHSPAERRKAKPKLCFNEWVSFLAGEPHSASPKCASPTISTFCMRWQDALPDDKRQMLKPYLLRVPGTRSTPEVEERRGLMCVDHTIRHIAPIWLRFGAKHGYPELAAHAEAFAALAPIVDMGSARAAGPVSEAAYAASRRAAWAAWAAWAAGAAEAAGAAGAAVQPVVEECRRAALVLLDRLIDCGKEEAA